MGLPSSIIKCHFYRILESFRSPVEFMLSKRSAYCMLFQMFFEIIFGLFRACCGVIVKSLWRPSQVSLKSFRDNLEITLLLLERSKESA